MSSYGVGAATAAPGSGDRVQRHNIPQTSSVSSQNGSEERLRLQQVGRSSSFNNSDSHPHHVRPLARVSSTSSIESNSLGRRRRQGNRLEEKRYNLNRGSHSESSLITPVEPNREPEQLSDTESLDGRRVRTKYTSASGKRRTTSWGDPVSEHDGFGSLAWRDNSSGSQTASVIGNIGSASSDSDPSDRNSQTPARDPSLKPRYHASETLGFAPRNSNGEGSFSDSARSPARLPPLRKNSDWEPTRSRESSNAGSRISSVSGPNNPRSTSPRNNNIPWQLQTAHGPEQLLSPRLPGRSRAHSSSSGPNEDISSSSSRGALPIPSLALAPAPARRTHTEVILPRWQPDAEVTFCPICRTQFSFFVRKHHCRKCGRVVCNSCSPHRITIPYQFIVQPPTDSASTPTSHIRPVLDTARAGSDSDFTSLGGGERVRLCNPCVPDPNVAPPQTPSFDPQRRPSQHPSHSRSTSLATPYYTQSDSLAGSQFRLRAEHFPRRPREPSILGRSSATPSTSYTPQSATLSNDEYLSAAGTPGSRSRSSTNSGSYSGPQRYVRPGVTQQRSNPQPSHQSLVPRDQSLQSRPLPRPPRLAEEDECPVCHSELPSSALPNSEDLRAAHINSCIESAFGGHSSATPPVPATSSTSSRHSTQASSSSATVIPIANTPEARAAAREQAHAAVVLGHSQSPTPVRRTGVFPYKATEKDCIDDAECTICLEEYEVGVDMCRLECLCRFHLHCIRQWFELHHGQCPVHQHDGGY